MPLPHAGPRNAHAPISFSLLSPAWIKSPSLSPFPIFLSLPFKHKVCLCEVWKTFLDYQITLIKLFPSSRFGTLALAVKPEKENPCDTKKYETLGAKTVFYSSYFPSISTMLSPEYISINIWKFMSIVAILFPGQKNIMNLGSCESYYF